MHWSSFKLPIFWAQLFPDYHICLSEASSVNRPLDMGSDVRDQVGVTREPFAAHGTLEGALLLVHQHVG